MRRNKCPKCGENCKFVYGKGYVCEFCDSIYSDAEISDNILDKLNNANAKRIENYDFEGALELCIEVLQEEPDNQEANFCALLAEYQIAYLQDEKGHFKPTFLDSDVSTPINKCKYYKKLNSTYRRMADFAETVRLEVVRASKQIPDYDVFICYKQHVHNSGTIATEEAGWAAELYKRLTKEGLRVFYDEISLKKGTAAWEPHIYAALKSSKYLVVLGSSVKNVNSTWVKNEWKRFLAYRKQDSNKEFKVVRKNFNPEELDYELRNQQMLSADEADWVDTLVENVTGHLTKDNIKFLLNEAEAYLLKRKFKKAKKCYLKVCNADIRNSNGYWGLLMCKLKAMDDYDLVKCRNKIAKIKEYDNAVRYAVGEEKERYEQVGRDNLKHNTIGYERKNYNDWLNKTKVSRFFKKFVAILLAILLCVSAVSGVVWYYNAKAKEYSFQLEYGESVGDISSIKTYVGEQIPDLPANLTIEDKYYMDFVGWFTQPDCKGIKVADNEGKSSLYLDNKITALSDNAHKIKLYAGFAIHKYTVKFYDDDGHTLLKTVEAEHGALLENIGSNIYVGDKQVLTWSENVNGEDFTGVITKDIELFAASFAITVEYDSNGGTYIPNELVRVGDKIPMPIPERQYYGFEGWTYQGNIVQYGFVAPERNITLVAQWSKTHYSLTLDSNGGLEDRTEMIKAGNTVSLPILSRQYYRFIGWEYNGSIIDNSFIMPQKDVILTAQWEKTHYAVSLDGAVQHIRIGESITLPTLTKTGYKFIGWLNGGKIYNGLFTPTDDVSLTSEWEANSYTVTLNANGGSVSQATQTVTYDSVYTLPVPTKEGYEFIGWYTSADKSGVKRTDKNGSSISKWNNASDSTLYAIWTKDYEIELDRASCKENNGYDPSTAGANSTDILAHGNWNLLSLIIGGCSQNSSGNYFVPQDSALTVSFKVLKNINSLPTSTLGGASVNWTVHYLQKDSYSGQVYGTNINGQAVGKGAYYIKVNYSDGTYLETNKVNFLDGAKENQVINVSLNLNTNKTIKSVEIVAVYELYYDYMSGIFDWDGTKRTANWRCTTTINFA